MHKFLRAVGFSKITKEELNDIFQKIIERPMLQKVAEDSEGNEFAELSIEFGDFFGLSLRGTFNENDSFEMSYYYPYFCGNKISTTEQIDIEKHAEKESYAGICDEVRLGVTLIFYLQNVADYLAVKNNKFYMSQANGTVLAALSTEGKILLPILKRPEAARLAKKKEQGRQQLIEAAREGNQEAIDSLTIDDMNLSNKVGRLLNSCDIYTMVESSIMPCGMESDRYTIIGEILNVVPLVNEISKEPLCQMDVKCNNICIRVLVNRSGLMGEPMTGRRFKGDIWLQGVVNFV